MTLKFRHHHALLQGYTFPSLAVLMVSNWFCAENKLKIHFPSDHQERIIKDVIFYKIFIYGVQHKFTLVILIVEWIVYNELVQFHTSRPLCRYYPKERFSKNMLVKHYLNMSLKMYLCFSVMRLIFIWLGDVIHFHAIGLPSSPGNLIKGLSILHVTLLCNIVRLSVHRFLRKVSRLPQSIHIVLLT